MAKIVGFDILRIIFMIMVFMQHIVPSYAGGDVGVAGFFLLGGFCLTLGYGDKVIENGFSWKQFFTKRAIRLYPVHWLVLLYFLLILANPHFTYQWIGKVFMETALLQAWIPKTSWYFAFNSPSWYLCDVLLFTAIFPFLYKGMAKLGVRQKLILFAVLLLCYIGLVLVVPIRWRNPIIYVNPIVRLMDSILGMYLAILYKWLYHQNNVIKFINRKVVLLDWLIILFVGVGVLQSLFTIVPDVPLEYWLPLAVLILLIALRSCSNTHSWLSRIAENNVVQLTSAISIFLSVACTYHTNYTGNSLRFRGVNEYNNLVSVEFCGDMDGGIYHSFLF